MKTVPSALAAALLVGVSAAALTTVARAETPRDTFVMAMSAVSAYETECGYLLEEGFGLIAVTKERR